ncbi:hypothetical protein ASE00_21775 [Sphingomonas sp. Root710]|nr:hypothetical protein ASE00_21775 [Sphingomonas sp. Root710]
MIVVTEDEVARFRSKLPAATAEQIMVTYGVSETTWRKLRKGTPVRVLTAERMRARYVTLP